MTAMADKPYKRFRVTPFMMDGQIRFMFQHAASLEPSVAMSIYETYLSGKRGSNKSVKRTLDCLMHYFTWAEEEDIDVETMLLNGLTPTPIQVRSFIHWLNDRISYTGRESNKMSPGSYNKVVEACSVMYAWFVMQFGAFEGVGNKHQIDREKVVSIVNKLFKVNKKRIRQVRFAEDLTEEEIVTIESYLKPENRTDADRSTIIRDYLLWRLAIEFGLRAGEIIALRLKDLPHGKKQDISVVRIEERGKDYYDPRGTQRPQPKTLSRDLGFIFKDSPIPRLISDYVSEYRCKVVTRNGKEIKMPILEHNFLFIGHQRKTGKPLSPSGMQRIAEKISEKSGVDFHWHIARHAFFNRAYMGIINNPNNQTKLMELVYWGGWSDENSLNLYVNRARKFKATQALEFWQTGENTWDALK